MSPEKPTDEQAPEGEGQAKPDAKAAAAKKPAAETIPDTAKPAAVKKPAAKKSVEAAGTGAEAVAAAKPARAPKVSAEKPAASKVPDSDAGEVESVAEGGLARARKAPVKKPATPKAEKPAREAQSVASTLARRKIVRAQARYVRTSARKARMVCEHLRGKSVIEARAILAFTPREVARDWSKLLESAVANAENNHELVEDDLFVREAYADEGPTIKRFRPRAQGRATPIRKRTSHLTITLTPKP